MKFAISILVALAMASSATLGQDKPVEKSATKEKVAEKKAVPKADSKSAEAKPKSVESKAKSVEPIAKSATTKQAGRGQRQGRGQRGGQGGEGQPPGNAQPTTPATNPAATLAKSGDAKPVTFDDKWMKPVTWRNIGPPNMGGRIVAIAVEPENWSTFYLASASGGLFKTVNNGTTFTALFDKEATVSIGDVQIAPSDVNTLWIGTGEQNPRNSVSWGDGVYKSIDGGTTWKNMGLKKSFQIGRIAIHPTNPNIVYVGALGRLWGDNEERGVYKTIDGGKTWQKVLHVDNRTGCIDLQMSPKDPDLLLAAMWQRKRDIYDGNDPVNRWGPGSGLYRTKDGGKSWERLAKGLPTAALGRIGVTFYAKNPRKIMITVETDKVGQALEGAKPPANAGAPRSGPMIGVQGQADPTGLKLVAITEGGPAEGAGLQVNDILESIDGKPTKSTDELAATISGKKAGDKVKATVKTGDQKREVEVTLAARTGFAAPISETTDRPFAEQQGGQLANMQGRQGKEGYQTGGIFQSLDGGDTWERINSLNPRPFYYSQIRIDPEDDKSVYVLGIQLHVSTDGGKTFQSEVGRTVHADNHALWINPEDGNHMLLGCDGGAYITYDGMKTFEFLNNISIGQFYYVAADTKRPYNVYGGLQDNGCWGGPSAKRGFTGPTEADFINFNQGDGFVCQVDQDDPDTVYGSSQNGGLSRVNLKTGERAGLRPRATKGQAFRFNWSTPFLLSSHNQRIYYAAGNYVFRSLDRGNNLRSISPQIARTERGTASALAESPVNSDVLYVGTDDGWLWISRDGGHTWQKLNDNLKLLPGPHWISAIEASRYVEGRVYVSFDGHRSNDDAAYILASEDLGKTWTSIRGNLPEGSVRCIREDVKNANVLYAGCEFSAFVTVDRGKNWTKLGSNLPTVAVHEFAQPRNSSEIVAATHGRSFWIVDVAAVRQVTDAVLKSQAHLFKPDTATQWSMIGFRMTYGNKRFVGQNPTMGATISYYLGEKPKSVSLKVTDLGGRTIRDLGVRNEPGFYQSTWDMRGTQRGQPNQGFIARVGQQFNRSTVAEPGLYNVVLTVDGKALTQEFRIVVDPEFPNAIRAVEYEEESEEERERGEKKSLDEDF